MDKILVPVRKVFGIVNKRFWQFVTYYSNSFSPKLYELVKQGYTKEHFKRDLSAGITVAIVSLPLSLAFAIASGVSPDKGLYTAIVAGFLMSMFGGARYQIGGPTGAFVVIVFNIIQQYEYSGLLMAMMIAGVLLLAAGFLKLGTYIKYIPFPVVVGFTSGIAVMLFSTQLKDLFGLQVENVPVEFLPKWRTYLSNVDKIYWVSIVISMVACSTIFIINYRRIKLPPFLMALVVATIVSAIFSGFGVPVDTIGGKFGDLPVFLPKPTVPEFNVDLALKVLPSALTIAFLTGIESLLSATVLDSVSGDNHNSNAELIANGMATMASACFSGMPATGAIARSTANYKAKAYSPVSGLVQSVVMLLFMLFLSPLIKFMPLASLSVILIIVAFGMFGAKKFLMLMHASKGERAILIVTFLLTMFVDLNAAISIGFILSSIMFMHRMSLEIEIEADDVDKEAKNYYEQKGEDLSENLRERGLMSLRFSGPLFFGVSSNLGSFFRMVKKPKILILRMAQVNVMDSSAANTLVEFFKKMRSEYKTKIILSHLRKQPQRVLIPILKAEGLYKDISFSENFEHAISLAKKQLREIEKQASDDAALEVAKLAESEGVIEDYSAV